MGRKANKLPDSMLGELRVAYEDECISMVEIASWAGCSRMAVWKFFKKHGVETRKGISTRRQRVCDKCGVSYEMTRSRYRDTVLSGSQKKHFCGEVCYHAYLGNKDTRMNRHKQRIAREKVSEVFDLQPEHVVHHRDFDHFNTALENFVVFANNSDHIKYHHQLRQGKVTVKPVWEYREPVRSLTGYSGARPKR